MLFFCQFPASRCGTQSCHQRIAVAHGHSLPIASAGTPEWSHRPVSSSRHWRWLAHLPQGCVLVYVATRGTTWHNQWHNALLTHALNDSQGPVVFFQLAIIYIYILYLVWCVHIKFLKLVSSSRPRSAKTRQGSLWSFWFVPFNLFHLSILGGLRTLGR